MNWSKWFRQIHRWVSGLYLFVLPYTRSGRRG